MRKTFFIAFGIVFGLTVSGVVLASRNSSGTYSLPAGNPVVSGTTITTTWANGTLSDLSTEVTDSLSRSGKGSMLAPVKTPDGTVAAPAFTFTNEPGTGLYRAAAGDARVSVLGVDRLKMGPTGFSSMSAVADGASAVGHIFDTTSTLSTSGAKIASFRTAGSEKASIDKDGKGTFATLSAGATSTGVITADSGAASQAQTWNSTNASGVYTSYKSNGTTLGDVGDAAQCISGGTSGALAITSRNVKLYLGTNSSGRIELDATNGYAKFTQSNPSSSTGFTNTLTPSNIVKAWGYLTCGAAGAVTVNNGFNIASASYSGNIISVTLATGLSATNAAAVSGTCPDPGGYYFDGKMTSTTNLNIQAWWGTGSMAWTSGNKVTFMVIGLQ